VRSVEPGEMSRRFRDLLVIRFTLNVWYGDGQKGCSN
jgi:hypothetical protein